MTRLPMSVDRNTDDCLDRLLAGTSWDRDYRISPRVPWWWSTRTDNLSNTACALLMVLVGVAVIAALVTGQRWQQQRCADAATTATPCGSVTP